jgi:hypothetical protein
MITTLEYSTRMVQEGGRWCKKSTLNDLVHLTPLRIRLMNPPYAVKLCCHIFSVPCIHYTNILLSIYNIRVCTIMDTRASPALFARRTQKLRQAGFYYCMYYSANPVCPPPPPPLSLPCYHVGFIKISPSITKKPKIRPNNFKRDRKSCGWKNESAIEILAEITHIGKNY